MNNTHTDLGLFTLRSALAGIFISHGYEKATNMSNTLGFLSTLLHLPMWLAYLVTYGEIVLGVLMLLGIALRPVGTGMIVILVGTIYFFHGEKGFSDMNGGWEYPFILLSIAFTLTLIGGGSWTIQALRFSLPSTHSDS